MQSFPHKHEGDNIHFMLISYQLTINGGSIITHIIAWLLSPRMAIDAKPCNWFGTVTFFHPFKTGSIKGQK